ncbi:hypothetical protein DERF_004836 [Dermatophagoides farinae]|uniref:A-kinase anchor protein 2 C-terminal domain-containing protein n=1 Tax=Dermatophagoides farinae TaxID=6954 RepID=A0A922I4J1_DERFA|nr:hypothetical protein DERF_004836 [Dermatophagoides farinae]
MHSYTTEEKTMIKTSSSSSSSHRHHHHHHNHHLQSSNQNGFNSSFMMMKSPLSPSSTASSDTSSSSSSSSISNSMTTKTKPTFETAQNGNISRVNIPIVFNKNRGHISMYRFINTKGKKMNKENGIMNGHNNNGYMRNNVHHHYFDNSNDYDGLVATARPPSSTAAAKYVISNHHFYKKRISAIDKIQEELREMKLREDELRCQRIRVGVSYPNLNSICDDDFTSSDDQAIESSEENKDSFHSRCSSNPDLLNVMNGGMSSSPSPSSSSSSYTIAIVDIENTISSTTTLASDTSDSINDCGLKIGGPRRKIPLIAIWEQKIQQINECQNGDTSSTAKTTTNNDVKNDNNDKINGSN